MSNEDIIRAWKDEAYRNSLSEEQKAQLPEDPAGIVDVTNEESNQVRGGLRISITIFNVYCAVTKFRCINTLAHFKCGGFTFRYCTPR